MRAPVVDSFCTLAGLLVSSSDKVDLVMPGSWPANLVMSGETPDGPGVPRVRHLEVRVG
jgi:hypothetical protein